MSAWIIWVVAGLALLMLEIHAPGAFMMWLGLAACGTGMIVLATGLGFELQVVTFGVLAAISLGIGLRYRPRRRPQQLNTQQAGLAGRSATALAFQGREGRVRVGDSDWAARVPSDVPEPANGARMRVDGVDGTVLIVRPES